MWSHDTLSKLVALRRDELLKQAQRERAAQQAAASTRSVQLADRILAWTGQQLIIIGRRLQSNHRAVMTSAALRTAHHNR